MLHLASPNKSKPSIVGRIDTNRTNVVSVTRCRYSAADVNLVNGVAFDVLGVSL